MKRNRNWESAKFGQMLTQKYDAEKILQVGRESFTRREIIEELGIDNFRAAKILTWALEHFEPKNIKELAGRITLDDLLSIGGVGNYSIYVWMTLLEYSGIDCVEWAACEEKIPFLYNQKRFEQRKGRRRQRGRLRPSSRFF